MVAARIVIVRLALRSARTEAGSDITFRCYKLWKIERSWLFQSGRERFTMSQANHLRVAKKV